MKNIIQSLVKIVWEMNLDTFWDEFTYKTSYGIKNYVWDPNADVENENFWLIFHGKFEQKTQKSVCLQNQWKLKNIKKAIVVNILFLNICFLQNQFVTNFEEAIAKNDFRHFPLFETFALIYFCREIEFLLIYSFLKNRLQKLRMRKF